MAYPPEFWAKVRADYESGEFGLEKLAKMYQVSRQSIANQKKKNGWVKGKKKPYEGEVYLAEAAEDFAAAISDDLPPPVEETVGQTIESEPAETETVTSPESFAVEDVDVTSYEQRIAELEAKLASTERELAAAEEEIAVHDPRKEVPFLETVEDYLEHVGYEDLSELALSHLGRENIKRHREGKPPLEFGDDRIEATINEIVNKRIRGIKSSVREEDNMRTLKMVKPSGTLTQVPVETQINNEAGQQGAAIWKARDKGFKIAFPYRCHRHNCWALAAVNSAGAMTLDGYCTVEHRAADPYLNTAPVAGVSMSGMPMSSTRDSGRADTYLAGTG